MPDLNWKCPQPEAEEGTGHESEQKVPALKGIKA